MEVPYTPYFRQEYNRTLFCKRVQAQKPATATVRGHLLNHFFDFLHTVPVHKLREGFPFLALLGI